HRREIEAGVLRRLAHLDEDDVAPRELAGAADGRIRALDAVDGDHGPPAHHDAPPDVELPDPLRCEEAETDGAPILRPRPPGAATRNTSPTRRRAVSPNRTGKRPLPALRPMRSPLTGTHPAARRR